MTFEQLYYFCEVYRQKSFSISAFNLRISRQSLSFSMKRLEEELGVVLFARSIKGVEPTTAGSIFYQYAQNVLLETWKIRQVFQNDALSQNEPNIYKLGVCDYIMGTCGKELYTTLSQRFPEQYFSFSTLAAEQPLYQQKNYDILLTIVNQHNLDLAALKQSFGEAWEIKWLHAYPIYVWLSQKSIFLKDTIISFASLQNVKFCTLKGFINETKTQFDTFLGHYKMHHLPLSIQLEENFADYIEKFGFATIDIPFKNNTLAFEKTLANRSVVARQTDLTVVLIAIYKKDTNEYLYQYLCDLLLNIT